MNLAIGTIAHAISDIAQSTNDGALGAEDITKRNREMQIHFKQVLEMSELLKQASEDLKDLVESFS